MGGLVARDFVGRWRHPVEVEPQVAGASVCGVILVGTPNHGSEWARLRVWLELRDFFATAPQRQLVLFHGLRDGTGAARWWMGLAFPPRRSLTDIGRRTHHNAWSYGKTSGASNSVTR